MFGYVIPDKPNMYIKDFYAFRAFYCGLCKSIGKSCGCIMRFATTYDATILNLLVHNLCDKKVEYKRQRCILHPFRKREMTVVDDLSMAVADINSLLTYYKIRDNIIDKDKKLRNKTLRVFFKKGFKKASKRHPIAYKIIHEEYDRLNALERENCKSIDLVSDCFSKMMERLGVYLTKNEREEVKTLFYCLGKWIYLIDALDDATDDFKKNRYNPWISAIGYEDEKSFYENNKDYFNLILKNLTAIIKENYDKLPMPVQEGVLTNTFYYGLDAQTDRVLRRDKKCQKTRL